MTGNRYRDAAGILAEEKEKISKGAIALVDAMGIDVAKGSNETYIEHAELLALALQMYYDRNQEVHDAWERVGYLGNLLTLYGKVLRLMNSLWWKPEGSGQRTEKSIDNAIDAINYSIFLIRGVRAGNERGML